MKTATLFASLILAAVGAQAQTYVGASVGHGSTLVPALAPFHSSVKYDFQQSSPVGSLFVGHRRGWWGVEAGAFTLPRYHSTGYVGDYPAYRAAAGRPMDPNDNTVTARAAQQFDGHALYLRGQVYAPQVAGFTPYVFAGIAHATTHNREQATYNEGTATESSATHDETFSNFAPVVGLGVQRSFGRLALRLEWLQSKGLQDNPHTLKRTVSTVTAGLSYNF